MSKWNKETFVSTTKKKCEPRISNIILTLVNFTNKEADLVTWGRGEGYGAMTFKCKSIDCGILPLFHLTSNGQIKFPLNYLKLKINKKEIIRDFQLKLESNFMMYFDENKYPNDTYLSIDELFVMQVEVDKFILAVQGISARLHQ